MFDFMSRFAGHLTLAAALLAASAHLSPATAQTRAAPSVDPAATAAGPRPIPGPVYETPGFSRAVARGTRTRSGRPGAGNWVQYARYQIDARLNVAESRLEGRESVIYLNNSPDTLRQVAVYLRQNLFAAESPRRSPVPITGGVKLERVSAGGRALRAASGRGGLRRAAEGGYLVDGTVMWIQLPEPLMPADSARLEIGWSFTPPPAPSDGREGHEGHVYFMG